jgi:hypothetical protein
MRNRFPDLCEKGRITHGDYATERGARYGAFVLRHPSGVYLRVIAASGEGWEQMNLPLPAWEHVSVSTANRPPTWEELCWVADLFFNPDEWLVQYRPGQADYVNEHPHTLHLWKPVGIDLPRPPRECV